jgi:hypothetical protein
VDVVGWADKEGVDMRLTGALIKEQGVVFAVFTVKNSVLASVSESKKVIAALHRVSPFQDVPIVLASVDGSGRYSYRGRSDLAGFLAKVSPRSIPWRRFEIKP